MGSSAGFALGLILGLDASGLGLFLSAFDLGASSEPVDSSTPKVSSFMSAHSEVKLLINSQLLLLLLAVPLVVVLVALEIVVVLVLVARRIAL